MLTKRKARRLYAEAQDWYGIGIYSESSPQAAPTASSCHRIAYDAGRDAAKRKEYVGMPLEVWVHVYAAWIAS